MGGDPRALQTMVQMLNGFQPGSWHYVIVHRAGEYAVARLTTDRARPFAYVAGETYETEELARAAVARLADTTRGRS
jgi:hypothetical protein